ncbi:MAG: NAD(P)H-hydrate dehydratase, partial [Sphingomonas sp.]
ICGPGNNGGDGYVAARILRAGGINVRVAASRDPGTEAAADARRAWGGAVEILATAAPAPVLVDALFGTGLTRRVDDDTARKLGDLCQAARLSFAVDLPSGMDSDSGEWLAATRHRIDITLALGALKPVHVLAEPGGSCGEVRIIPLPIDTAPSNAVVIDRPNLAPPTGGSTKYNRGMLVVVGGVMPGAASLASEAAMRAGAGYGLLLADDAGPGPRAVVRGTWSASALDDERIGAILVGPGLGRDGTACERLAAALATERTVIIDGDALHLIAGRDFRDRKAPTILTPHAGEFAAAFGTPPGNKIDAARTAAARSGAVIVFKGPTTVIADPSGDVVVSPNGSPWLSTAGTGDVLAGTIGALAAGALPAFYSAQGGVWLHAEAARRLGGAFIADDLARELSAVRGAL